MAKASYELNAVERDAVTIIANNERTSGDFVITNYSVAVVILQAYLRAHNTPIPTSVTAALKRSLQAEGVTKAQANRYIDRSGHFIDREHKRYMPTVAKAGTTSDAVKVAFAAKGIKSGYDIDSLYKKAATKTKTRLADKLAKLMAKGNEAVIVWAIAKSKKDRAKIIALLTATPAPKTSKKK